MLENIREIAGFSPRREPRQDIRQLAFGAPQEEMIRGDEYLRRWARDVKDEERVGILRSLRQGVVNGLLEPFELFGAETGPGFSDEERTLGGSLAYGLGYFASFMIPAAATYKVAGKALQSMKLIDSGSDLLIRANMLRTRNVKEALKAVAWRDEALMGSVTGALIGAGMTGKDENLGENVLVGAVTGAIGDPLMAAGMKVAGGLLQRHVADKVPEHVTRVLQHTFGGRAAETLEEVDVLARAWTNSEQRWDQAILKGVEDNATIEQVKDQVEWLGLRKMNRLEARILRGVSETDPYINELMEKLGDQVDFRRIERNVGTADKPVKAWDYLVGLKGHLDEKLVTQYMESAATGTPWWDGMWVLYNQTPMRVVGRKVDPKSGEEIFEMVSTNYFRAGNTVKRGAVEAPTNKVSPMPQMVMLELGPEGVKDVAPRLYSMWIKENGGAFAQLEEGQSWDEAVDAFLDRMSGKTGTSIRWRKGGVGQVGDAAAVDMTIPVKDARAIIPDEVLKASGDDPDAFRFLTQKVDAREPIAPPTVEAEVVFRGGKKRTVTRKVSKEKTEARSTKAKRLPKDRIFHLKSPVAWETIQERLRESGDSLKEYFQKKGIERVVIYEQAVKGATPPENATVRQLEQWRRSQRNSPSTQIKDMFGGSGSWDVESWKMLPREEVPARGRAGDVAEEVVEEVVEEGGRPTLKVTGFDGVKRLRIAEELGKKGVPVQVRVTNAGKVTKEQLAEAIEANRWQNLGNNQPISFGQVGLDLFDQGIRELSGPERAAIKGYFKQQVFRELGKVDPTAFKLLMKQLGKVPMVHPEDELLVMAAQVGFDVKIMPDPATGDLRFWLKDVMPEGTSPGAERSFASEELLYEILSRIEREMPNLDFGINVPTDYMPAAARAVPHTGSKWHDGKRGLALDDPSLMTAAQRLRSGLDAGASWRVTSVLAPMEAWLREFDNFVIRNTGVELGISDAVHTYMQAVDDMRKTLMKGFVPEAADGKTLGIDELIKIRGGTGYNARIKGSKKKAQAVKLLDERDVGERTLAAKALGFTDDEVAGLNDLDDFMLRMFEQGQSLGAWGVTGDDFLQYYWPVLRSKATGRLDGKWQTAVKAALEKDGKVFDVGFEKFHTAMARTVGEDPSYEVDPYLMAVRYMRALASKKTMEDATIKLTNTFSGIQKLVKDHDVKDLAIAERVMKNYIEVMTGTTPEHYATARLFFSKSFDDLGIELREKDFDKVVNTVMGLNYGAFMGLRPGLAIRNLSQILAVTVPLVQDPVAMARGFRKAVSKNGVKAARDAGAIGAEHGIPFEDVLFTQRLYDAFKETNTVKGRSLANLQEARRWLERASEVSLGNKPVGEVFGREITLFGKPLYVGWYSQADEFNRAVSFHAMRERAKPHINDWMEGKTKDLDEALRKAGVTFMGESHVSKVKQLLDGAATADAALDYIGVRAAHETQWIYKQGAGPYWMANGKARLFGQYGTWPAWWLASLYRGATAFKRDPVGAARFWAWNGLFLGAVSGASALTGYDWGKYSPVGSVTWAGGPIFDYVKDFSTVMAGIDSPSGQTNIVLSEMGFGSEFKPWKTYNYFMAPFIPGAMGVREFFKGGQFAADDELGQAFMKAFLSTNRSDPEEAWPMMDFKVGGNAATSWLR